MNSFDRIQKAIADINVSEDWKDCEHFKTVVLVDDATIDGNRAHDKSGARNKRGVYRWTINNVGMEGDVLYIGKSSGITSSIAGRQTAHFDSFKNPWRGNERSGPKLHAFMEENNLQELEIMIEYMDMTHCHPATVVAYEEACIE